MLAAMFVRRGLVAFKSQFRNLCCPANENAKNVYSFGMIKTLQEQGSTPDTAKPIAKVLNVVYEKLSQSSVSKEELRTGLHFVSLQMEKEKFKFDMEKKLGDIKLKIDKQQSDAMDARVDKLSVVMNARVDKLSVVMNARVDKLGAAMDARSAAMDARVDNLYAAMNARVEKVSEVMDARFKEVMARIDAGKFDAVKIYVGLTGSIIGLCFASVKLFN